VAATSPWNATARHLQAQTFGKPEGTRLHSGTTFEENGPSKLETKSRLIGSSEGKQYKRPSFVTDCSTSGGGGGGSSSITRKLNC
jgi:hypothetical protein